MEVGILFLILFMPDLVHVDVVIYFPTFNGLRSFGKFALITNNIDHPVVLVWNIYHF